MSIEEIVRKISLEASCEVLPAAGVPRFDGSPLRLPSDLEKFYQLCGGVRLFKDGDYSYNVAVLGDLIIADPNQIGQCECNGVIISRYWYFIADDNNGAHISIDLDKDRLGRCYDCMPGEPYPRIAESFTDLLTRLYYDKGGYPYWLQDESLKIDPCL